MLARLFPLMPALEPSPSYRIPLVQVDGWLCGLLADLNGYRSTTTMPPRLPADFWRLGWPTHWSAACSLAWICQLSMSEVTVLDQNCRGYRTFRLERGDIDVYIVLNTFRIVHSIVKVINHKDFIPWFLRFGYCISLVKLVSV